VWRYSDARVVEVDFNRPDALGKPNGAAIKALDIAPHAGAKEFDDSSWEQIGATTLEDRRSNGRLAFSWHRLNVRIPEQVGGFDTSGSTVVFEVTVDDYAEVWVDGELPRELGQSGGSLVAGWNAPNGVVVTRGARPGQRVQLAIFGANGPPSDPPPNDIWIRSARLLFIPANLARRAGSCRPSSIGSIRLSMRSFNRKRESSRLRKASSSPKGRSGSTARSCSAIRMMKIDELGNLYVSGPGGVWIISAAGKHLGTIAGPELPANMAWGDADRRTLYLTARTGLYRIRLNVRGAGTALQAGRTMAR